ncbi:hypothetical protein J7E70_08035 [Variovorax paradoxus]|nr:hypothetical protein [Variovorax paradoxus]MBT2300413.1 hypothetical protein [Variovorax paradoxus]
MEIEIVSDAKHIIKGPWHIVERETLEDGSVYPRHVATDEGDYQICLLESQNMAALGYDRTPAEQERDRLIATAPELLAATLKHLNALEEEASANMALDNAEANFSDARPEIRRAGIAMVAASMAAKELRAVIAKTLGSKS